MGKSKNNKEKPNNIQPNVNIAFPESMSKEDMIDVLSSAIAKADAIKAKQEQADEEVERKNFCENIGIKEFTRKNGKPNRFRNAINKIFSLIRMLFLPAKKVEGERFTVLLLSFTVKTFCSVASFLLWLLTIILIIMPIMKSLDVQVAKGWNCVWSAYALLTVLFAQLFRLAGIEAEKMKDKNFLATVLAAILAFVTIVITIILR